LIPFSFAGGEQLSILCVGAHADDIEIGAGGLILTLARSRPNLSVKWCVLSASGDRAAEATASAEDFLSGIARWDLTLGQFQDSYFPEQSRAIKRWLINLRASFNPDLVLAHTRRDAHQDHRETNRLIWNIFRDSLIIEYEIPKWDGDLGQPNFYAPLQAEVIDRKINLLIQHFSTQRSKDWFDEETFRGLARIRGMECRSETRFAEAFIVRKARLALAGVSPTD
jgi:LmbE family N-acetylglucosaminyl deacetylase